MSVTCEEVRHVPSIVLCVQGYMGRVCGPSKSFIKIRDMADATTNMAVHLESSLLLVGSVKVALTKSSLDTADKQQAALKVYLRLC